MAKNRDEIMDQIRILIAENLEMKVPEKLNETDRFNEDLNIDSIMLLQLVVYIEEVFGVDVPEENVDPAVFQTVGALVTFMEGLLTAKV